MPKKINHTPDAVQGEELTVIVSEVPTGGGYVLSRPVTFAEACELWPTFTEGQPVQEIQTIYTVSEARKIRHLVGLGYLDAPVPAAVVHDKEALKAEGYTVTDLEFYGPSLPALERVAREYDVRISGAHLLRTSAVPEIWTGCIAPGAEKGYKSEALLP